MTDHLDGRISQLVGEIVDVAPTRVEPQHRKKMGLVDARTRRSPTGFRLAMAAAVVAVLGVSVVVAGNRFVGEDRVDSGTAPDPGVTYRFVVETSVDAAGVEYENPEERFASDIESKIVDGPSAEGEIDASSSLASMRLTTEQDSLFDRIFEPTEPTVVFEQQDTIVSEVDGVFYELNPFVPGGQTEGDSFGPLFPEATKTLERANVALQQPDWVEVGKENIDGTQTTHLRADLDSIDGEKSFITDSVIGFIDIYEEWEGKADIWVRDDGLVARIIVNVDDDGRIHTVQLDYVDYGTTVDVEWPDISPITPEIQQQFN